MVMNIQEKREEQLENARTITMKKDVILRSEVFKLVNIKKIGM